MRSGRCRRGWPAASTARPGRARATSAPFGLFVDGVGADAIYVAKLAPKATVTDTGDSKWSDGDDPVGYDVTLTAKYDDDAKTAMRFFFGGPGWKALLVDMGFATAPPAGG